MGSCEESQRPPFNSSAGAGLARPPGPQVLPGSGSVLSSQLLGPLLQSPYPSCYAPLGAPDPHLPQPNVHSHPPHPQACIRTRGILSALLDSSGSPVLPRTSALQSPGHTPAGLRHSATPRPQPPLRNVNSQGILLLDGKHKQNLQSACAHMTHAHRHNTPVHPSANTQS